ncbi:MAG TPA: hypothetical protein VK015_04850, partial [Microbacterium sp.]|nr:hypothetical protein [Microbacterium sp.]
DGDADDGDQVGERAALCRRHPASFDGLIRLLDRAAQCRPVDDALLLLAGAAVNFWMGRQSRLEVRPEKLAWRDVQ